MPAGTCNKAACAFPRVCFCAKIQGQNQNGADCSPVNNGPCTVCIANNTRVEERSAGPATPLRVLYTEFSRASDDMIDERLEKLDLDRSGSFAAKTQRLAEYVHAKESQH